MANKRVVIPASSPSILIQRKSLLEVLTCPICQKALEPPAIQCQNGHLFCKSHKKALKKCPACGSKLSSVDPSTIQVLQVNGAQGPESRSCVHAGCPEKVAAGDDHEFWCGFRQSSCRFNNTDYNCKWKGQVLQLPNHVKEHHLLFNRCTPKALSSFRNVSLTNIDIRKHAGWGITLNSFFWVEVEIDGFNRTVTFKVTMVPVGRPRGVHQFWLEIRSKTTKICTVTNLDLDRSSEYPGKNCARMHMDSLRDAVSEDGLLRYKLQITKEDSLTFDASFF